MNQFKKLQICIASPQEIISMSGGEVTKSLTIDYKTLEPKEDGLFCARIFGPIKDYRCSCGKLSGRKHENTICSNCGVEVTTSQVRRLRMGHINLAAPIIHIWFFRVLPSYISILLNIPYEKVEYIISNERSSTIYHLLKSFDLVNEYVKLKRHLQSISNHSKKKGLAAVVKDSEQRTKMIRRFYLIESYIRYNKRPEWMILTVLPVLPPDLRPLIKMKGNVFVSSDLNYFYKNIINRNNRLKELLQEGVVGHIITIEEKILQQVVDCLLDNNRSKHKVVNRNKEPLKSLTDRLSGKEGRFRHNLLGKRVDYSGRSVIVSGPRLRISQCGLPLPICMELFKPLIYFKMTRKMSLHNLAQNKYALDKLDNWKNSYTILLTEINEIIKAHPVLLNRAPTLHKMNVQGFEPIVTNSKVIQLHPLVCASFNADFDGDQMAVHLPLSIQSQIESRLLCMSNNNIISPANHKAIITPSQDIVFGIYYTTLDNPNKINKPISFPNIKTLLSAIWGEGITLQTVVRISIKGNIIVSTVGRILLYNILPNNRWNSFEIVNINFNKSRLQKLIGHVYETSNVDEFTLFIDQLMYFGFYHTYHTTISLGRADLTVPYFKWYFLSYATRQTNRAKYNLLKNIQNYGEVYQNIIDIWSTCLSRITDPLAKGINSTKFQYKPPFYMLIDSGSRGSITQMRQMSNLRGLMIRPSGRIVETPITSNFKEGLTVVEYFLSAHGSRKGVIDTSIRTATAGYLTRRIINSSQDTIIVSEDCHTSKGIVLKPILQGAELLLSVYDRSYGRVSTKDIHEFLTGEILIKKGEVISDQTLSKLKDSGIENIKIRSPLTCHAEGGVCQKCYGLDLGTSTFPKIGQAIGVLAAQSIGEPGTQLTMRTFHLGGILGNSGDQESIKATSFGKALLIDASVITTYTGHNLIVNQTTKIVILDKHYKMISNQHIPYGSKLFCRDGDIVYLGQTLAAWEAGSIPIISTARGQIEILDASEGFSSGKIIRILDSHKNVKLNHTGIPVDYFFRQEKDIYVQNGQFVDFGEILGILPRDLKITQDITGDISKISQLFEVSKTNKPAILSPDNGFFQITHETTTGLYARIVSISPRQKIVSQSYFRIPKSRYLNVPHNTYVKKGDMLTDGIVSYNKLLTYLGVSKLVNSLLYELQRTYLNQGIHLSDKHFEIIIMKMIDNLKKDNTEEEINRSEAIRKNLMNLSYGNQIQTYSNNIYGITNVTLKNKSFISAASFQNTSRVLIAASAFNKISKLSSPQENIIIGRLIPVGTGYE